MKIRVHDDIGHSILSARRALLHGESLGSIRDLAALWERSAALLCRANEANEPDDAYAYALERAEALGVHVFTEGELPESGEARELFALAVRECCTNCVRHAAGTEVYVRAGCSGSGWRLEIRNNGTRPAGPIREGGGLGALRRRVERGGGTMDILSSPEYSLRIILPKEEKP